MVSVIDYPTEGGRIFLTSLKNRFLKKKYTGNDREICEQIVKDCWNGTYFQTSTGNFPQFWTRDFGWCAASLVKLGYKDEVHKTLRYALNRFLGAGKVTTTITPQGKPFDFPTVAVDSLPWLVHAIKVSKFGFHTYKEFLNREVRKFYNTVIDTRSGLVKENVHFSSIKDFAVRKSACYDNSMVGLLAKDLAALKLENPFARFEYSDLLVEHFWNGRFFTDDLQKFEYVAGDANVFPYLFGLVEDKEKLRLSIEAIEGAGLDTPFPLKYTSSRSQISFITEELFLRDYESCAIWTHIGIFYIKVLGNVDPVKAGELKRKYGELIVKHKNFLEVFNKNGEPFSTPFYYCDSGLLWAANYLTL